MPNIPFICKSCGKEDSCDTKDEDAESFRSPDIIIKRCSHCGHRNRIVIPSSEE